MQKSQKFFCLATMFVLQFVAIDSGLREHIGLIFSHENNPDILPVYREYFHSECIKYIEIIKREFGERPLPRIGVPLAPFQVKINYRVVRAFFMKVDFKKGIEGLVQHEFDNRPTVIIYHRDLLAYLFFLPLYRFNLEASKRFILDLYCSRRFETASQHLSDFNTAQELVNGLNYIILLLTFGIHSREDVFSMLDLIQELCKRNCLFYNLKAIPKAIEQMIYVSEYNDPDLFRDVQTFIEKQPKPFIDFMAQRPEIDEAAEGKAVCNLNTNGLVNRRILRAQNIAHRNYLAYLYKSVHDQAIMTYGRDIYI